MNRWTIYAKNGSARAISDSLELHDEWMAESFLTVSVKSADPIDFSVGDFIIYRGERYSINYDPSRIKKARRGTYGEGFVYDNIKFVAVQDELVRCDFCDIVLSDNQMHYTALPTFPFYCETVDDLLDRIQANMEELYPGDWIVISPDNIRNRQRGHCVGREAAFIEAYDRYIGAGSQFSYEKTGVALTVDNINCWEALAKVHSDFGLNFIIRDRIVVVGTAGIFTANTFKYGKGNGLYEIEVVGDSEQKVTTRLRAYGSETNLPERYYAVKNTRVFSTVTEIDAKYDTDSYNGISFYTDLRFSAKYFKNRSQSYPGANDHPNYIIRVEANDVSVIGFVSTSYKSDQCYFYCEWTGKDDDDRDEPDRNAMIAFIRALNVGDKVYFTEYVDKSVFDLDHTEATATTLPDNMAVNRLMLPGFPDMSLDAWVRANRPELIAEGFSFSTIPSRPFIDSPNISKYGVRPSSIYFDGSDDNDDIHPTIDGMSWEGVASDAVLIADQIEDNGVLPDDSEEADKRVTITIPYSGFMLNELWNDDATISMKDGMCGARDFKILKKPTQDESGNWICVCERAYDSTLHLYFPYSDFQIHTGDKFVLTGIDLPDSYVEAASIRLFDAAMNALRANHEPRVTYQPRIDHLFMARQNDEARNSGGRIRSLHDTLKAGDMFVFQDTDLNINAAVTIDVLTIKENGEGGIPTYEVTLRDEKTVSIIRKIQDKVNSMFSGSVNGISGGSGSGGGSYNTNQLLSLLENFGKTYFLSKVFDDEAEGNIGFKKNVTIGGKLYSDEIVSSEYTGEGMLDTGFRLWYENGRAKMVIDDLIARGKFSVYELESRIMTHVGGDVVFSGAGSKIFYVEYLDENDDALGYTTINSPWMLRDKMLLGGVTGLAAWANRRKIQRQLTDAQKAQVRKFRCYVFSDDGTMKTRNWWRSNDLARCQTYDHTQVKQTSVGYYSGDNVSNTVYWRRIAGIGSKAIDALGDGKIYDYFDLWNVLDVQGETYIDEAGIEQVITDNTPGYDVNYNDWPAAGDDVVQFGNAVDEDRQSMVVIEVTTGEPGMKVYNGVNTYNTSGCKWVGIGYDSTIKRAYADVFGDFYFGARGTVDPRNGSTYVRFNSSTKLLEIKARISLESTYGDGSSSMTLADYIASVTWTQEEIERMIGADISEVQKQIDGRFDIHYGSVVPTTQNAPASSWDTPALKESHVYDLYYDRTHDKGYRWIKTVNGSTTTYSWSEIGDSSILKSLKAAANAQDTADGKRRVFVITPIPPYDEGDLWVNANYTSPITHETIFDNDIVRCINTRATGDFDITDWENASKYTDDSALEGFINDTYANFVTDIQGQVDSKSETWYQATDPATSWSTDKLKKQHVGDIWMNTSVDGGKKTYIYQNVGTTENPNYQWKEQSVPDAVFDKIDGKAAIYVNTVAAPPTNYHAKDLWILPAAATINNINCKQGELLTATQDSETYNQTHWVKKVCYTDDSALTNFVNVTYQNDIEHIQSQIDGKIDTYFNNTDPSTSWTDVQKEEHVDDVWFKTDTQKLYRYKKRISGQTITYYWDEIHDDFALQAYKDALKAQDTADGKRRVFISQPQSSHEYDPGDLWVNATYGTTYSNDLLRCKTHKNAGDSFNISHWEKASKYTDDSAFNNWVANRYAQTLTGLNDNIGGAYRAAGNAQSTADDAKTAAGNAQAAANALGPIKNALNGATLVDGGLLLTSLIGLRKYNGGDKGDINNYTTWGGINGVYGDGNTIAAWFGGGMVDHELTPTASNYAKILFRMNGSGYMAGGKFSWDKDGNATIGGFEIGTKQLGAIDYNFEEGWAFIQRDGFLSVNKLNAARTYSAEIYGGAAIYAGVGVGGNDNDNYIKVNSSGVYIHGNVYINSGSNNLKAYYHSDELGTGGGGGSTSVAWSDITGKPATFTPSSHNHDGRYYISSGTIYLAGSSITPLTSHQSLSGYATENWTKDWINNTYDATIKTWVDNSFFKKGGGLITGNVQLKPDGANYGCYILFGDRPSSGQDYAYIGENSDDHMVLYGKRGVLVQAGGTGGASGRLILESLVEGWVSGIDIACNGDSMLNLQSTGTNYGIIQLSTAHGVSMYSTNENTVITLQDWSSEGYTPGISILTKSGNITLQPSNGSTEVYNFVNKSDIRNKNILEYKDYSVEEFARAPLFGFTWKEGSDRREHIGTSAQYWQSLIPETVAKITDYSKDGKTIIGEHLSLDYITLSFIGVVSLAREIMRLRESITELKNSINN